MGRRLGWGPKLTLAILWGAMGCVAELPVDEGPSVVVTEPVPVVRPVLPTALNSGALWLESIEVRPASRVWAGGDGTLMVLLETGEAMVRDPTGEVILEAAPDALFETVSGIGRGTGGELLLGHPEGLAVRVGDAFLPSPLNEVMGGVGVLDLLLVPDTGSAGLWISTADGLWRFREGEVAEVAVADYSTAGTQLSYGPVLRQGPAMWVVAGGTIYVLDRTAAGWSAWSGLPGCDAQEAGATLSGALWVRCGEEVRYRSAGGVWHDLELKLPVSRLYTHPGAERVWLRTTDDELFYGDGGGIWPVELTDLVEEMVVDGGGNLVLATSTGVVRASPGRGVVFENIPLDSTLVAAVEVTLSLEEEELVVEAAATLDGEPLSLGESGRTFTLDPPSMPEGGHVVEVVVSYSDTDQVSVSRVYFTVFHPGWERDIRPISDAACRSCHGDEGLVSLKLATYEQWRDNAERILEAVSVGLMPPGEPLGESLLETIRYWYEASQPQ